MILSEFFVLLTIECLDFTTQSPPLFLLNCLSYLIMLIIYSIPITNTILLILLGFTGFSPILGNKYWIGYIILPHFEINLICKQTK